MRERERERKSLTEVVNESSFSVSSHKGTNFIMRALPSSPSYLPKTLSLNTIILEIEVLLSELEGRGHKHPVHNNCFKNRKRKLYDGEKIMA
jgi:hypothetical protein